MKKEKIVVELGTEVKGVDEITEKAEKLIRLLKEAKSLVDELALMEIEINVKKLN